MSALAGPICPTWATRTAADTPTNQNRRGQKNVDSTARHSPLINIAGGISDETVYVRNPVDSTTIPDSGKSTLASPPGSPPGSGHTLSAQTLAGVHL